jgi:Ca-activated chloride channel family protein
MTDRHIEGTTSEGADVDTSQRRKNGRRQMAFVGLLLLLTLILGVVAEGVQDPGPLPKPDPALPGVGHAPMRFAAPAAGPVHFNGQLDRGSVLQRGDGTVKMELVIRADAQQAEREDGSSAQLPADLVVLLDRSGSMQGSKLAHAKAAIRELMSELGDDDRFGLVTYASSAAVVLPLATASASARDEWSRLVESVDAGGGTNMSNGLDAAHGLLARAERSGRAVRVILISDGHANEGDSSVVGLRGRVQRAVPGEYVLSTVGVGARFDEGVMTTLADAGMGNFYYVSQGSGMAGVFSGEFASARERIASGVVVSIANRPGVSVVDAAGYPLEHEAGSVRFRLGELFAGQERRIWVSLRAPTRALGEVELGEVSLAYELREGKPQEHRLAFEKVPAVTCVESEKEYYAGVDKAVWRRSVMNEDYNRMRRGVASAVERGDEQSAVRSIQRYRERQQVDNQHLRDEKVEEQLESLSAMEGEVKAAFSASPSARSHYGKKLTQDATDGRRVGAKR